MDRSVFSFIEPLLHNVPFMGWDFHFDQFHQPVFDNNYGNVIICFQIAYGVGFIIAGRVIDRLGTKTGYAIAILIWALSSMSHSLVTSVVGFCVARIFLGLGESGNFPAAIKATTEWFPTEERGKAVGLFNSGSNASFFLAPLLIGFATAHYGWRAAFLATGSLGVCWLVVWMIFPYNRLRRGSTQTQANLEADFASQTKYGGNIPLLVLLQRPGTYAFAIGKGLTDGVWWFYLFYLPQFLNRNYGLDLKSAYWYIVTVYVISTVGSIFGGTLSGCADEARLLRQCRPQARHALHGDPASYPWCSCRTWAFCSHPIPGPRPSSSRSLQPPTRAGPPISSPPPATCSPPPPSPPSSALAAPPARSAEPASPGWSNATCPFTRCSSSPWPRRHTSISLAIFQLLVPRLGVARAETSSRAEAT